MMTRPDNEAERLSAFVDGELDLQSHLAIERAAAADESLRQRIDELQRMRQSIRAGATYHAAPSELHARLARLAPTRPAEAPASVAPASRARAPIGRAAVDAVSRWLAWRPLAASFALAGLVLVTANVVWLRGQGEDRIADDVVASHVRASLGQHVVDVASSDHHTVKPWLSARLDFSPPVTELSLPGSAFLGGRVDYLDGRPVAALVYRQGQHLVTSFVWPASGDDSDATFARQRGFETAHWVHGRMNHWVVSDLNRNEFRIVVDAIRQQESAR
jgi:anti-sigma factor RsiW